ncbi:hypothetical protein MJ863_11575 [Alcaligenes ammonioxydans]|uniref:hypothetical protein n=1 Tax=Alcaligenes ammonioxydans TaxID=2582914 RepID=UPI001F050CD3|nr:hypothetical protein [Alcaligenes ammonioxydans]MCH1880221.1 hypothetical protein [Alcaligenes ammonioxydans]
MLNVVAAKIRESINETFKEAYVKESQEPSALRSSMDVIENSSLESVKVENETALNTNETVLGINETKVEQIEKNREDGANREEQAFEALKNEFPEEDGYKIEREQYLRDENGNIVKDPETGEARRMDFVVTKDGKVVKSIEVTSETAPKDAQIAKEERIRDAGGNFIKDRDTGQLVEIPKDVQTEVRRYP